ncbi:MAG: hypothetical protein QW228_01290 [Candidatus Aenigmatarchaeota archaeon]
MKYVIKIQNGKLIFPYFDDLFDLFRHLEIDACEIKRLTDTQFNSNLMLWELVDRHGNVLYRSQRRSECLDYEKNILEELIKCL